MTNAVSIAQLGANNSSFTNRIINGAMVIDQRNAGASVTVTGGGTYTLDRYATQATVTSKFTIQQTPSATETGYATRVAAGFTNYLACTSSSAYPVGAAEQFGFYQPIEGLNMSDLAWGTSNAKTITLSFLVYSSLTGTFGGSIRNNGASRSYPFSYSIPTANTWTSISVTIAGDTTGTWLTSNGVGMYVGFSIGAGASLSNTANTWVAGNYWSATGATSVVGTSGATFYITGVQLEKGSTATSFDYRPYGTELALCQRYYYKIYPALANRNFFHTLSTSTTSCRGVVQFPETLRTPPAALEQSGAATDYSILRGGAATVTVCSSVPTFQSTTVDSATTIFTVASGFVNSSMGIAQTAAGTTAGYLAWSAEL
jgi:hypothetical protein